MATRIEALASFSNKEKLSHVGGGLSPGQEAVVADEYADELGRLNLAEVVEEGVSLNAETTGSEPEEETGETITIETQESETEPSDTEGSDEETKTSTDFRHTDYVEDGGALTEALPKHGLLADRGITTFEDLAQYAGDFQEIKGVGPSTEEDLTSAWKEIVGTQ